MREIPLTQGQVAIVDDADYDALSTYRWCAHRDRMTFYADRHASLPDGGRTTVRMHRQILGVAPGVEVDHENGNGLDNRRENIRICTHQENQWNANKWARATSRFKGVSWEKSRRRWVAAIRLRGKAQRGRPRAVWLGRFTDEESAARAYDAAARKHFGDFAACNFDGTVRTAPKGGDRG
jgi:hypothetical protein